jgi:phosphatidylinositol alpha-1,6-mannosyltransferase
MAYGSELWSPRGRGLVRRFGRRIGRFLAISEFTRRETEKLGVDPQRVCVVRPGGDLPSLPADWRPRLERLGLAGKGGDPEPFLLTVARLAEPHKGQDVVIRSMPALARSYPEVRYVIAGDGPLRDHFRAVAKVSSISHAVLITGMVDELTKRSLLEGCRAFVMPSREAPAAAQFEGFGIAFVEAALAGRPVIAGASGAVPEVVSHGETGLLVDPHNPVAIIDAASRILGDQAFANAMGERARARALREFTWVDAIERMNRELRMLI